MFAIMYFMVIMPQQRQRKKMQAMLAELKAGDKIVTSAASMAPSTVSTGIP